VHDPFVVDQHAVGDRVVVADDRVDEFVNEGVGLEAELLDGELRHFGKEAGARHVRMLRKPRGEPGGDAAGLRHAADAGWMLHHPLALGQRELSEEEEALTGGGGDPVGIAAASIEEGGLGRPGGGFGEIDQFILDLERA